MNMTPDCPPHTDSSTQPPALPPNITTLAGPQPWVIRQAKAHLVDLIICYEELLDKFRAERTKSKLLALKLTSLQQQLHQHTEFVGQFMKQANTMSCDLQRQVDGLHVLVQSSPAIGKSLGTGMSDSDSDDDEENITFASDEGRAFLQKYGDEEDIVDVNCGPDNQRRQALQFGPGSPFYEAQNTSEVSATDISST
ncbi:hypothetical protein NMY22_g17967 [Coprinellus aureogranulatus]|nr:hypothetical protein NMY22_g17967 [Coprinellus aureogranulatus]